MSLAQKKDQLPSFRNRLLRVNKPNHNVLSKFF